MQVRVQDRGQFGAKSGVAGHDLYSNIEYGSETNDLGTETGFQKVSRCPRSVSLGRKYPIPVSKIKYELFRKSFRRPKSDQEIRLIYR